MKAKIGPGSNILIAVSLFAAVNICVKHLHHISFFELVFFRSLFSLSISLLVLKALRISPAGNHKKLLVLRGLAGTGALTLFFFTLQSMPLASAVTVQYTAPIFAVLFSRVLIKEEINRHQILGFVLAFAGVILIKGFDSRVSALELSLGLVAATFAGCAYTIVRILRNHDHPWVVVFYFPLVTLPIISPLAYKFWTRPIGSDWLYISVIGLFTTLAQYFMTKAYQGSAMASVAIFNYVGVIMAISFGYTLFGEAVSLQSVLGMFLIVFAVVWASKKRQPTRT